MGGCFVPWGQLEVDTCIKQGSETCMQVRAKGSHSGARDGKFIGSRGKVVVVVI